jgi:hypothetical protein
MDLCDIALPELLFAGANASVHFALACLELVPATPAGSANPMGSATLARQPTN